MGEIIKLIFFKDEDDLDVRELRGRKKGKDLVEKAKVSLHIQFCPWDRETSKDSRFIYFFTCSSWEVQGQGPPYIIS